MQRPALAVDSDATLQARLDALYSELRFELQVLLCRGEAGHGRLADL
jgi:hypothetical protein